MATKHFTPSSESIPSLTLTQTLTRGLILDNAESSPFSNNAHNLTHEYPW